MKLCLAEGALVHDQAFEDCLDKTCSCLLSKHGHEISSVAKNIQPPGRAEGVRKGVASSAKGIAAAEDVP